MQKSKKYQAPRLERFGQLSNLTTGASHSVPEVIMPDVRQANGMDRHEQLL